MTTISRSALLIFSFVLFGISAARPGEVEDLIGKNIAARGGRANWEAIQSLTIKGQHTAFSKVSPYTLQRKRDLRMRFESQWSGKPILMAYDGVTAWTVNGFMEMEWPQRMDSQDFIAFRQELDFANPFFDYLERGDSVELIGPGEVEGIEGIAVKLTRADGQEETWYFDPNTFLEVARESAGSDFGSPNPQRTFFEDFREVEGVKIPFFTESQWYTRDRIFEVEEVEVNPELEESLFAFPPPPGMDKLASLAGDWQVKVEERQSPRAPWSESARRSAIISLARGAQLQEVYTASDRTEVVWSISYDQFRENYRLTWLDDFTSHLNLQDGNFEADGRLILDNVKTESTWSAFGRTFNARTSIVDIEQNSFRLEQESSTDGGENWQLMTKFTYTRVE